MTLITIPNRMPAGLDFERAKPLLNANFEAVTSDLQSFSPYQLANSVSPALVLIGTVAGLNSIFVGIYDTGYPQNPGEATATAQYDLYIDGQDATHRFPDGSALTAGMKNLVLGRYSIITPEPQFTYPPPYSKVIGAHHLTVRNLDASTHTYYMDFGGDAFKKDPIGQFR